MPLFLGLRSLFRNLFRKPRVEQELDEEMQASLALLEEEKLRAGMDPQAARRAARLELGGVEAVKESVREARRGRLLEDLWQDARYGARLLRKSPGFTAVAVLTLALGVGATAAIYSVVHAVLLRPLPYAAPDQLALLSTENTRRGFHGMPLPPGAYFEFQEQSRAMAGLAVFRHRAFTLTGGAEPRRIRAALVSANLFEVLDVQPLRGRTFTAEEDLPGGPSVCLVSYGLWQRRLGGAADAVGRTLRLESDACEVIGVLPAHFNFPEKATEVWQPLRLPPGGREWGMWALGGVARLHGGTTLEQAQAEVDTMVASFTDRLPFGAGWRFVLTPLREKVVGEVEAALWILFGTAGFVLLIASVNLANLLLARLHSRSRELAVRAALGAGRARLRRQVLTENLLLALLGGAGGVALAVWAVELFRWLAPADFPRLAEVAVDGRVLGFALGASLLTAALAGLLPARQAARRGLAEGLREGAGARGIAGGRTRVQSTLVGTEVALAVVLLLGAGLLLRSLHRLLNVEPGFTAENALTLRIQLPSSRYGGDSRFTFFQELEQRIAALPDVVAVGLTTGLPTRGVQMLDSLTVEGAPEVERDARPNVAIDVVSPGYFRAAGIPLLEGQIFHRQGPAGLSGVVINEAIARRFFPGRSAVGQRILGSDDETWHVIAGVVGNVKQFGPDKETPLQVYLLHTRPGAENPYLVVRTTSDPVARVADIKSLVRALDPDLPVAQVQTLAGVLAESVAEPRFNTVLMACFAALALALAVVGIYGVMAYATSRRTQEMGIRLALGAQPKQILRLVIGQGMLPALAGLGAGVAAGIWLTGLLRSLLFEVSPTDPATFAAVVAVLLAVAVLACYLPARRASRVDPVVALRYE